MTVPIITLGWLCVTVQDLKATVRLRVSGHTLWDAAILTAPLISGRTPTFPEAGCPSPLCGCRLWGTIPSLKLFPHSSVSAMYPVQPRISGAELPKLRSAPLKPILNSGLAQGPQTCFNVPIFYQNNQIWTKLELEILLI